MIKFYDILKRCENSEETPYSISFATPPLIAMLAVYLKMKGCGKDAINPTDDAASYLDTMGFYKFVWDDQTYKAHPLAGRTYAPLISISCPDETNTATTQLNNCIQRFIGQEAAVVNEVAGELLDNIWAHGKALGVSIAQLYGRTLEIAIVDGGDGFKKVLNRAGVPNIKTDADAIEWCIQKGHSSSKFQTEDDWAQALPSDNINSPFPDGMNVKDIDANHHEGLGLFKLVELIRNIQGDLQILSGKGFKLFVMGRENVCQKLDAEWHGVAISFALPLHNLKQFIDAQSSADDRLASALTDFNY